MIIQLVNEEGTVIGTTDITSIRMNAVAKPAITTPPRHNERWSSFEDDNLQSSFNSFIKDRAKKQGRTEDAILFRVKRMLPYPKY